MKGQYEENKTISVKVRRCWNDPRFASYRLVDIVKLHFSFYTNGVHYPLNRPFLYGWVVCNQAIDGEIDHSCNSLPAPHFIRVCIPIKGNESIYGRLEKIAGPKPEPQPVGISLTAQHQHGEPRL